MIEKKNKNARLEARLPESVYQLLRQAAELQGRSLSDFVVCSARDAAERTIANHNLARLTLVDQRRFAERLLKPTKPSAAMKRAARRHADWVEKS